MAIKGLSTEVIGLSLLGVSNSFAIWSAANPSVFTVSQFTTEQSKENARLGMNIGLGLNTVLSAGLYFAYGKKGILPAALTAASGVGLYVLYEYLLGRSHVTNPHGQTMAQQAETMQGGYYDGGQGGAGGEAGMPGEAGGGGGGRGGAGGIGGISSQSISPDILASISGGGRTDNSGSRIQGPGGISGSHSGGNIDTSGGGQRIQGPGRISGGSGNFPSRGFDYDSDGYGYIYPPPQNCIDHPNDPCIMEAY